MQADVVNKFDVGAESASHPDAAAADSTHDHHHEPLMACIVAAGIGILLLGTIRQALFAEAQHTSLIQAHKSLVSKRHTALPNANQIGSHSRGGAEPTSTNLAADVLPLGAVLLLVALIAGIHLRRMPDETSNDSLADDGANTTTGSGRTAP